RTPAARAVRLAARAGGLARHATGRRARDDSAPRSGRSAAHRAQARPAHRAGQSAADPRRLPGALDDGARGHRALRAHRVARGAASAQRTRRHRRTDAPHRQLAPARGRGLAAPPPRPAGAAAVTVLVGIAFIAAAVACFASMDITTKFIAVAVPAMMAVWSRN